MNIGGLVAAERGNEKPNNIRGYFEEVGRTRVLYNSEKISYAEEPTTNISYTPMERSGFL